MFLQILFDNRIPVELAWSISDYIPFVEIAKLEEADWFLDEMVNRRNVPPFIQHGGLREDDLSIGLIKFYLLHHSNTVYSNPYLFIKLIEVQRLDLIRLFDIQKLLDKIPRKSLLSILDTINQFARDPLLLDYLIASALYQRVSIDYLSKKRHLNIIRHITESETGRKFAASAQAINNAARMGYLDVVIYLHKNRSGKIFN
jgi:hypothetical protein